MILLDLERWLAAHGVYDLAPARAAGMAASLAADGFTPPDLDALWNTVQTARAPAAAMATLLADLDERITRLRAIEDQACRPAAEPTGPLETCCAELGLWNLSASKRSETCAALADDGWTDRDLRAAWRKVERSADPRAALAARLENYRERAFLLREVRSGQWVPEYLAPKPVDEETARRRANWDLWVFRVVAHEGKRPACHMSNTSEHAEVSHKLSGTRSSGCRADQTGPACCAVEEFRRAGRVVTSRDIWQAIARHCAADPWEPWTEALLRDWYSKPTSQERGRILDELAKRRRASITRQDQPRQCAWCRAELPADSKRVRCEDCAQRGAPPPAPRLAQRPDEEARPQAPHTTIESLTAAMAGSASLATVTHLVQEADAAFAERCPMLSLLTTGGEPAEDALDRAAALRARDWQARGSARERKAGRLQRRRREASIRIEARRVAKT